MRLVLEHAMHGYTNKHIIIHISKSVSVASHAIKSESSTNPDFPIVTLHPTLTEEIISLPNGLRQAYGKAQRPYKFKGKLNLRLNQA